MTKLRNICGPADVPSSIEDWLESERQFLRTGEIHDLQADSSAARKNLGWQPMVDFAGLVRMMVDVDLSSVRQTLVAKAAG